MGSPRQSARTSQKTLFPELESTDPGVDERSETGREEFRRVVIASGRQKGVGIHVFGVASGEKRISKSLSDVPRGSPDYASLDLDDVILALKYLQKELGEKPVEDFLRWLGEEFGYELRKVTPLSFEERLSILEAEEAEDARVEAALLARKQRRRSATVALRGDLERAKDGVR